MIHTVGKTERETSWNVPSRLTRGLIVHAHYSCQTLWKHSENAGELTTTFGAICASDSCSISKQNNENIMIQQSFLWFEVVKTNFLLQRFKRVNIGERKITVISWFVTTATSLSTFAVLNLSGPETNENGLQKDNNADSNTNINGYTKQEDENYVTLFVLVLFLNKFRKSLKRPKMAW